MGDKTGHKFIERGAHKGKGLAVFTSGGDSQVSITQYYRNYKIKINIVLLLFILL